MVALLGSIIEILVGGLTQMATGIGTGINSFMTNLFVTVDSTAGTYELTTFGGLVIVFAGISLAVGIGRWALRFVTTLGN